MTFQVRFVHKLQQVKVEAFATKAEALHAARAWAGSRQDTRIARWQGLVALYSSGRRGNKAEVSGPHARGQDAHAISRAAGLVLPAAGGGMLHDGHEPRAHAR